MFVRKECQSTPLHAGELARRHKKTIASCFGVCCTSVPFLPVGCLRGPRALCASLCVLMMFGPSVGSWCLAPSLGPPGCGVRGCWPQQGIIPHHTRTHTPVPGMWLGVRRVPWWWARACSCVGGCVFRVVVACCTEASPKPSLGPVSCLCGTRVVLAYVRGCLHVDSG